MGWVFMGIFVKTFINIIQPIQKITFLIPIQSMQRCSISTTQFGFEIHHLSTTWAISILGGKKIALFSFRIPSMFNPVKWRSCKCNEWTGKTFLFTCVKTIQSSPKTSLAHPRTVPIYRSNSCFHGQFTR